MDGEKAKNIIGRGYLYMVSKIINAYKSKDYITENKLVKSLNGKYYPIACYLCLERIEGKHPKFNINGSDIRTHNTCVELESIANGLYK